MLTAILVPVVQLVIVLGPLGLTTGRCCNATNDILYLTLPAFTPRSA
jgi:hypothetical protein